jgi:SAM-dependent methyltransferase
MPDELTPERRHGMAFDQAAAEYDRRRPGYPDHLIDRACEISGLVPGSPVLEIGCGTGQLTRSLLARGLRVTAVEPGARLANLAREGLRGAGDLELVNSRFEDAELPRGHFRAAFAASSMHWVDPGAGWQRAAHALAPGGTLALIQYFGLDAPHGADDQRALLSALFDIAPEIAGSWPRYRDLETTLAGVRERSLNISEVWSWLGGCDLARDHAGDLFEDTRIVAQPQVVEQTAAEVCALLGTMSFWSRLSPAQRSAVEDAIHALHEELGRPFRASIVACLVTARLANPR